MNKNEKEKNKEFLKSNIKNNENTSQEQTKENINVLIEENEHLKTEYKLLLRKRDSCIHEKNQLIANKNHLKLHNDAITKQYINEIAHLKKENEMLKTENFKSSIEQTDIELKCLKIQLESLMSDIKHIKDGYDKHEKVLKRQLLNRFKKHCADNLNIDLSELYKDTYIDRFQTLCKTKYNLSNEDFEMIKNVKNTLTNGFYYTDEEIAYVVLNSTKNQYMWYKIFFSLFDKNPNEVQQEYDSLF